ncbi:MAG TPA: hypothetical protein VKU40_17020, partial [Thermoanaerobaculia bacterium]|nr:hypothetical protein [Thermoanaerobaculia bacterium]
MNDLPNQLPSFLRDLPPVVLWSLAGIFGLLLVATTIVWLIGRAKPGLDLGEVRQRVRSWWVMAGVCAIQVGASRRYDGPMGKSDRAVAFGAAALLLALVDPAAGWLAP